MYSYAADSVLDPQYHLAGIGHPYKASFGYLSHEDRMSLIGEGFAAPCVSSVVAAFYLNPWGTWWRLQRPLGE